MLDTSGLIGNLDAVASANRLSALDEVRDNVTGAPDGFGLSGLKAWILATFFIHRIHAVEEIKVEKRHWPNSICGEHRL
jgi:hypothetical protein